MFVVVVVVVAVEKIIDYMQCPMCALRLIIVIILCSVYSTVLLKLFLKTVFRQRRIVVEREIERKYHLPLALSSDDFILGVALVNSKPCLLEEKYPFCLTSCISKLEPYYFPIVPHLPSCVIKLTIEQV